MYKAYLFDFDYTLGDSTEGIVESANYALGRMGIAPSDRDAIRRTVGMHLTDAYTALTGDSSEDARQRFYALFRERADEVMLASTALFPDALPTLRALKRASVPAAIVTTKTRYRIEQVIGRYNMSDLVATVIGCEDVKLPKPDPEGVYIACGRLGVAPSEVLFVGDSVIDAKTARAAGASFAAVTTGTTGAAAFDGYPRAAVCASLSELLALTLK